MAKSKQKLLSEEIQGADMRTLVRIKKQIKADSKLSDAAREELLSAYTERLKAITLPIGG